MNDAKQFLLSPEEVACIKQLPDHASVQFEAMASGSKFAVRLTRTQSEDLRAALTDQLARVGFDKDYSPTAQGQIIEDLIDKLFVA
jgi:hypothetical protein